MFRLPRALPLRQQIPLGRPIQLPSRVQSRNVWTRFGSARKQIQPVRMTAARFTWKKVFALCVYTGTTYWALQFLLRHIDIQIEEIEEDASDHAVSRRVGEEGEWEEQGDDAEDEEDEFADEDSTFIPMTWATKLPRSFYKGSDPEWQAFVKVAKDKPRQKKIQDELLQLVFAGLQHHPKIAMQLGKDLKIGRWWLEIQFPDGPPQEYVRSGLEIGDDFIAWSPQKISPETYHRTTRALWPKATFEGFFATAMIVGGIQYRKLKQALGWEDANPFSVEERFKLALEMMEKQKSGREGSPVSGKAQTSPDGSPGSLVSAASAANEARSSPRASEDRVPLPLPLPWQLSLPLPLSTDLINPVEFQIARHVFAQQLMKGWRPKKLEPPRGSFVVQGLMDIRGSKARVMFDVQACYDPKESKFVVVNAGVRSIKRWNQAPKGGP